MDKRKQPHTEEHKRKVSEKLKGHGFSAETLAKMRKPHKPYPRKPISKETREKIRQTVRKVVKRGADSNLWKGGINKLTWAIRKCWRYVEWRSTVYERDNYTCKECSKVGGKIEAHHIVAFSKLLKENNITTIEQAVACEQLWSIGNGLTLCKECHKKTPNYLGGANKG